MIHQERLSASLDGEFVVFLIGMRINKPLHIHKWLPVASAMPRMLKELAQRPELGLLHAEMWFSRTIILVQYWRSMDQLLRNHLRQHARFWPGQGREPASGAGPQAHGSRPPQSGKTSFLKMATRQ